MNLGVHLSISGGYQNSFIEAKRLGIDAFQIFTKNQRQWKEKTITPEEAIAFKANLEHYNIKEAFSHATYLINLASMDDGIYQNSVMSLASELLRCEALGLKYTVLHPGAGKGLCEADALERISHALQVVLHHTENLKVKILLENTAGQGSCLGYKFEHLSEIINQVQSDRLGICLDTCHAYAAGYDIRTTGGLDDMFAQIDKLVGLQKLNVIHINDSKGDLGSCVDRHDHIGKGKLGVEPFRYIVQKFPDKPKVLETNKDDDMDMKNLEVLKGLY